MKRAEVCKLDGEWFVDIYPYEWPVPRTPIRSRTGGTDWIDPFPAHTDALSCALKAVGLATPPEHREAP